jgi:predicted ATPase
MSASQYVKQKIGEEVRTYSNGENGFRYFVDAIQPGGLYLLDEPENSLSPEMQLQLTQYLLSMARFYQCQFVIATHSPFILSIPFAKIYNMDEMPVKTCKWTEYDNVRVYYEFFKQHSDEFEGTNH